ncbi:MAG: DUF1460 domain-containing protein [Gemmatimonadota bacterium]|nr:DUF1460 domain-containing protein [Gemmatimonadota bacterium]
MRLPACTMPRRTLLHLAAAVAIPWPLRALTADPDLARLTDWVARLRAEGLASAGTATGRGAARVGELAAGTPYEPGTLEAYLRAGGDPMGVEPLALSLTRFDCVTLVESCLAIARLASRGGAPTWEGFGREVERMRYRCGVRQGYGSRLHYFSDWISNGAARGLVRDLGAELGGVNDPRPLRFMSEHRGSYPALAHDRAFAEISAMERDLDGQPRLVVPRERIPEVAAGIATGDVLAFATEIPGLDVTHAALAYRDARDTLRVLHAPLSGGVVEVTRATLPEYVAALRRCTGVLVARPLLA